MLGAFDNFLVKVGFVNGIFLGAMYAVLALPMVLTFRVNRVVGFVHAGIATAAGFIYWFLVNDPTFTSGVGTGGSAFLTKFWPKGWGVLMAVILGVLLGAVFGAIVTGRMATWPRTTVTVCSLGMMLLLAGLVGTIWKSAFEIVKSPFGDGTEEILEYQASHHEIATISILVLAVAILAVVISRTKLGVQLRAISDDVEGAEMVGIPVRRVSMGVWCVAGGMAGLAGVLIVPRTRVGESIILFVLTRALAGAVLGGFESITLAIAGCLVFGQVESHVTVGTFGVIQEAWREFIIVGVLFALVFLIATVKRTRFKLEEA